MREGIEKGICRLYPIDTGVQREPLAVAVLVANI
jgi:hypothetical protein